MENLKKNGQVGQTLTWIIAILIIFFFLFAFILTTTILVGFKEISHPFESNTVEVSQKEIVEFAGFKSLEGFLNSNADGMKVYDIIAGAKEEASEEDKNKAESFKKQAGDFMKFNFPNAKNDIYRGSWIRIYNEKDDIEKGRGYEDYEAKAGSCNLESRNLFINYFVISGKKIVLCIELK